jgi:lysozyme
MRPSVVSRAACQSKVACTPCGPAISMRGRGRYPSGTLPVWAVDAGGRVDFSKPLRRLAETELLDLLRPNPPSAAPDTPAAPAAPEPFDLPRLLARLAALFSQLLRRA